MNAKDTAAMNEVIAQLKTEFAAAMTEALAPLVSEVIELQQRSSNFAARVNASNKIYRAEIARLRDEVAALTPVKALPMMQRISPAEWDAAMVVLRKAHPGKSFFAPSEVRGCAKELADHELMRVQSGLPHSEEARVEDEEVSL